MNLFLIHGEYSIKSYERLQKYIARAKEKNWEIVRINKESLGENQNLATILSNQSLFGKERFFIIEDIKLISKKDLAWLKKQSVGINGQMLIYSDCPLSETLLKTLPPLTKNEIFKLSKNIFNVLDSFYPGNSRNCLLTLHELISSNPIEFIFVLLAKHLRDLYWVKISPSDIPYPSWRVDKLERQASKFNLELIRELINDLAEIDIKAKTSQANLIDSLDLLIIKKLE